MTVNEDLPLLLTEDIPLKLVNLDASIEHVAMQPFQQLPAINPAQGSADGLCAYDLFSSFTVDIMVQEKVFVR